MNTVPTITHGSITGMTGNDQRPVYFLQIGKATKPTLTVKGEQKKPDGEISIKWSSKLMKNVNDQQVNTKIMSAHEITVFKASARVFLAAEPKKLLALADNNLTWVKMPFLQGLSDADFWKKNDEGKYEIIPTDVKTILKRFTDSTAWGQLGKIIAVDLFNGNGDRFTSQGHWQNMGNVMFQKQANDIKVVGLDTFDPNSHSSNLTTMTVHSNGELDVLKSPHAMRTFAEKVIESVEGEIIRGLKKSGTNSFTVMSNNVPVKIDENSSGFLAGYTDDLATGLDQGAKKLKIYLQTKKIKYKPLPQAPQMGGFPNKPLPPVPQRPGFPNKPLPKPPGFRHPVPNYQAPPPPGQQKSIPQGILDRMTYLGW